MKQNGEAEDRKSPPSTVKGLMLAFGLSLLVLFVFGWLAARLAVLLIPYIK
jgi:hypothetical protein